MLMNARKHNQITIVSNNKLSIINCSSRPWKHLWQPTSSDEETLGCTSYRILSLMKPVYVVVWTCNVNSDLKLTGSFLCVFFQTAPQRILSNKGKSPILIIKLKPIYQIMEFGGWIWTQVFRFYQYICFSFNTSSVQWMHLDVLNKILYNIQTFLLIYF